MKFDVPLMMPAIHSMRLAVSPSRLDDWNAARHGRLERDHHALRMRGGEDLVAVVREQRLVGRDDVLAVRDRLEDKRARRLEATDQFDDDIDVRMREHHVRVAGQVDALCTVGLLPRDVDRALGDPRDADRPARAPRDLLLVAAQDGPGAVADRAHAEQPHLQRFHHASPSSRNICLMPRIAWRVRDSFSIIAKRTCSSPYSPKPMPGDTDTLAPASSFFANSSDPIAR